MATVSKWIPAPVGDVWAVIADPRSYAFSVVGLIELTRKPEGQSTPVTLMERAEGGIDPAGTAVGPSGSFRALPTAKALR